MTLNHQVHENREVPWARRVKKVGYLYQNVVSSSLDVSKISFPFKTSNIAISQRKKNRCKFSQEHKGHVSIKKKKKKL